MSGDHTHTPDPTDPAIRVEAIESLLVEAGLLESERVDALIERYEHELGPLNGARVVARAWSDAEYRARLLADGTAAIAELDYGGAQGERMVVVENADDVHNLVVCTLCSCYPWPVLGLPPSWYKSPEYRARAVREPEPCCKSSAPRSPTTSRSGCGTRRPRSATSCCPSDPREPRISAKTNWSRLCHAIR